MNIKFYFKLLEEKKNYFRKVNSIKLRKFRNYNWNEKRKPLFLEETFGNRILVEVKF